MSDVEELLDQEKPLLVEPTFWITDAELIRRSGVPEKIMRMTLKGLDQNPASGFPKKNAVWGNRRYWPAVKAFWDKIALQHHQPERKRA